MSPTQARTFHAVARAGSFTAAAKALRVSQPTVTTQIKDLEAHYNVELFHRHARGVTLTGTGQELLAIVRRIHSNQQDAIEFLRATQGLRTGHLRIGAYAAYPAIRILAAFHRRHPELEVSLHFSNSQTLVTELHNHDVDVAVTARWSPADDLHSMPYRRISSQVAIVSRSHHEWGRRKSVRIAELAGQAFVLREQGSWARRATEEMIAQSGAPPAKLIEIGSREGVMAAVAEGIGISTVFDEGIIPETVIAKLPIRGATVSSQVDVICLKERKDSHIISALFDAAEAVRPRTGVDARVVQSIREE